MVEDWTSVLMERAKHAASQKNASNGEKQENAKKSDGDTPPVTPASILMLALIACIGLGAFYGYDSAGAQSPSLRSTFNMTAVHLSGMYAAYSGPVIVLVVASGVIIDHVGELPAFLVLEGIILSGYAFIVGAAHTQTIDMAYPLFIVGFLLVSTQESLIVLQNKLVSTTFKGPHLSKALSLTNSINRVGTILAIASLPSIAELSGLRAGFWSAFGFCGGSIALGLIGVLLWRRVPRAIVERRGRFRLAHLREVPWEIYVLALFSATADIGMQLFSSFSVDILTQRFGYEPRDAGLLGALQSLIAMLLTPIVAILVDRWGRRLSVLLTAALLLLPTFLSLAWIPDLTPIPFIVLIGVLYAMCMAAFYPCVVMLVPHESLLATSLAIVSASQNAGILVSSLALGALKDATGSYSVSLTVLAAYAGVATVCVLLLLLRSPLKSRLEKRWQEETEVVEAECGAAEAQAKPIQEFL